MKILDKYKFDVVTGTSPIMWLLEDRMEGNWDV